MSAASNTTAPTQWSSPYHINKPLFYLGAEFGTYLLFLICIIYTFVYHRKRSRLSARLTALGAGVVYGTALEWLSMQAFHAYTYDNFLIMIAGVPLMIGVDWALILFSAMEVSDLLKLPIVVQAFMDSLFAINIDFAIDVVAIRIGFWNWANGGEYFGVPLSNFWGWLVVAFCFSLFVRLMRRVFRKHFMLHTWVRSFIFDSIAIAIACIGALVVSGLLLLIWGFIAGISISFIIYQHGDNFTTRALVTQLVMMGLFVLPGIGSIVWFARRAKRDNPITIGAIVNGCVPAFFHGYFFVLILISGMYIEYPIFLVISIAMGMLGAFGHLWPYWTDFWRRVRSCKPFTQQVPDPVPDELEYLTDKDGYSALPQQQEDLSDIDPINDSARRRSGYS